MLVEVVIVAAMPAQNFDPPRREVHVSDLEIKVEPILGDLRLWDPLEADPRRSRFGRCEVHVLGRVAQAIFDGDAEKLSPERRNPLWIGGAYLDPSQSTDRPSIQWLVDMFRHG
jgi:hypothetical protein